MSEVENKQESLETVKEDSNKSIPYAWNPDKMLEVFLIEPDNFLKIRETLTRIGIASRTDKKLYQSCHILHKQGRYFIVHFKELFSLDGKESNITTNDIERRNTIAVLMALSQIKDLAHKDKAGWELVAKYNIGKRAK